MVNITSLHCIFHQKRVPERVLNKAEKNKAHYDSFRLFESVIVGYSVFLEYFGEIGRQSAR